MTDSIRFKMRLGQESLYALAFIIYLCTGNSAFADNTFPASHFCTNSFTLACGELRRIKNPDFSSGSSFKDIIPVPHRGLWATYQDGYGNGPPQSSKGAIQLAVSSGFRSVEMDIIQTSDLTTATMHDYPLFRLTTDRQPSHFVFNRDFDELFLRLRKRNGSIATDQYMLRGSELIDEIVTQNAIVMVDSKEWVPRIINGQCVLQCDTEGFSKIYFLRVLKVYINDVKAHQGDKGLGSSVIKTGLTPNEIINGVTQSFGGTTLTEAGIGATDFNKLQFVVRVISERHRFSIANLINNAIGPWHGYQSSVAYFETTFKTNDDVQAKSFDWSGTSYLNMYDYLHRTYGLRGGFYTDEPVSSKGTFGRWSTGKVKNVDTDHRADFFNVLSLPYSGYGVFTTDNPQAWAQFND